MKIMYTCLVVSSCVLPLCAGTFSADSVEADVIRTLKITDLPTQVFDSVLYYDFESSPSGNVVVDASTNGYDGAFSGCTWSSSGRYIGGAMAFSNNVGSISVGTELDFPAWNTYAVSLWFLHDGGGNKGAQYGHKMLDKTMMYHDWHLHLFPEGTASGGNGQIGLSLYEDGKGYGLGDNSKNYSDNQWHHVVVVRDGLNGWFWVDGVLKQQSTNMVSVYSTSPLCVGNSYSSDSFQRKAWSGMLDEIQIYNRTLSSSEITSLYESGLLLKQGITLLGGASLVVQGNLSVTGAVEFVEGVRYAKPLGDLSSGIFTNRNVVLP